MSEELLSNDRRVEKHLTPPEFNPLGYQVHLFCYAATDSILATTFTSEWEQYRSLKNEERKREKVTWEVNECSRTKAPKRKSENLHKKYQQVYNNCYALRSRAIKNLIHKLHKWRRILHDYTLSIFFITLSFKFYLKPCYKFHISSILN